MKFIWTRTNGAHHFLPFQFNFLYPHHENSPRKKWKFSFRKYYKFLGVFLLGAIFLWKFSLLVLFLSKVFMLVIKLYKLSKIVIIVPYLELSASLKVWYLNISRKYFFNYQANNGNILDIFFDRLSFPSPQVATDANPPEVSEKLHTSFC